MDQSKTIADKCMDLDTLVKAVLRWRLKNHLIVFTNGCFDMLHAGHLYLLQQCKDIGGKLVVGLNGDASVRRLKGQHRPIHQEKFRADMLASLSYVDAVVIFHASTPLGLIKQVCPDVLIKGGNYDEEIEDEENGKYIVGKKEVEKYGGKVQSIPLLDGFSTTGMMAKSINNKITDRLWILN